MKKFMITGGLVGFLIGLVFGLIQQTSWPAILWRASVAAFCAGLLMRWWARIWVRSVEQAYQDRLAAMPKAPSPQPLTVPSKP